MSADAGLRDLFGLFAIIVAIMVVLELAIGRVGVAVMAVSRRSEPRAYWGAVGRNTIFALAFALLAMIYQRQYAWLIFVSLVGPHLFEMLFSGRVLNLGSTGFVMRTDNPRGYWLRLLFQMIFASVLAGFLMWTWSHPTMP